MKTRLIVIGKTADRHLSALIDEYKSRIVHYMPFEIVELKEERSRRLDDANERKENEADKLLKELNVNDYVVLLDERGKQLRSTEFAKWINKKQQSGKNLTLIIGGPFGFSKKIYDRSNEMIALSAMTFPHDMVRLILTEQIYRACSILKGESYHHE